MALIQLIYVSTARQEYDSTELDKLLESCRRHNAEQDITGMLLYASGSFLQVLEGEAGAVDETYGRIQQDPRHTSLYLLERAPLETRSFSDWHMGFRRLGRADTEAQPGYAPFFARGFDAASIGARPGLALDILTNFATSAW
jgi:hypothetical protein